MKKTFLFKLILGLFLLISNTTFALDPPVITATGNQIYCSGSFLNIVPSVTITFDPVDPEVYSVYIQISSGYINGQDQLILNNASSHPSITAIPFDMNTGILKLTSATGNKVSAADYEAAIKDVQFNSSLLTSGSRDFSISMGTTRLLSYLPRNKHFYEYIPALGITWTDANAAATSKTYYGLQGYLATLTAADEAQLAGEQAPGAGWIGGSDAATEGTWRWVTGPEAGTIMTYTNWNIGEPNQYLGRPENYAHITAPGVGNTGSWNDLTVTGDATGNYQPKGYIVEYGGMIPGDVDNIKISASTTIEISQITATTPAPACGSGEFNLSATTLIGTTVGTLNWYDESGNLLTSTPTNNFTTPIITNSSSTINTVKTYYIDNGYCRIPITITVLAVPSITLPSTPFSRCGQGSVTLQANSSVGIINWYATAAGTTIEATGTSFTIPNITANNTYYAEAFNNGCSNGLRVPVDIFVYTPPVVVDQEVTKCKSSTATLDAGISGMIYLWSTGETTQQIIVSKSGVYNVDVTSPAPENCSSKKTITVVEHNIPEIDRVVVNETTVVIYLKKEEVYFEYSVDGINYQSSNVFFNAPSGLQTAYVREINLCSNDSQTFIVLIAPKFFTPNGDTYNDFWEIKGLINYPQAEVSIFDRYGKLISVLNTTKPSWDGRFNNELLPADDYWYRLKLDDSKPEIKGHFSLKR